VPIGRYTGAFGKILRPPRDQRPAV